GRSATYNGFGRPDGIGTLVPDIPIHGSQIRLLAQYFAGVPFGTMIMQFEDDITSAVAGMSLYVDGVQLTSGFNGWQTASGRTRGLWNPYPMEFVEGVSYTIEVK